MMTSEDRLSAALCALYQRYGYRQYRMSKFEEYDLYAQNRNFLESEQILTFSDTNGRLMALKPDITLSIIKNSREEQAVQKVFYRESVYRVPKNGMGFQEIMQTGLECIGAVDDYAMSEVLMLAARSLEAVSPSYVLDLSHMGILGGLLSSLNIPQEGQAALLAAMGEKNLPALEAAGAALGLSRDNQRLLRKLCWLAGPIEEALPRLLALPLPPDSRRAAEELEALGRIMAGFGKYHINLDLSVVNDMDYYNGLTFRGFVDGASSGVLSGGRYDSLLHRMGKTGGAIGFAVYLNELERLLVSPAPYDVDVLLTYTPEDDPAAVAAMARTLEAGGKTVRVQPEGACELTYRQRMVPDGREV
ncbi:MAG: ATP phosphoribosyltransferase regulatory subunit [Oscillospiraceae bacterium]|nr:ATP phosphoribosyltransferase regulatory subunit [Oscillospiraceae bacterium]